MWQPLVPLLAVLMSSLSFAQINLAQTHSNQFYVPTHLFPSIDAPVQQRSKSPFFSHFTIESFGIGSSPVTPDYMSSSAYIAALFNPQGLECPGCIPGPRERSRVTLPPFGATATVKLKGDRVELFAGFGGIEAWKADGTYQPQGHRLFSSSDGDAWLTQGQAGFRFAADHERHLWFGGTGRRLYNFGPGRKQWNTLSGDAIFRFGR